jgi:DNA-binding MarR family transcriptional regulator
MPSPANDISSDEVDLGLLSDVIGFRLRRLQNHLSRGFNERLARKEVRPGVFSALALIAANPGLSQTALAREIGFDKATIVAIIDTLERLGWAERRQATTDRRRRELSITPLGAKSLTELQGVCLANEARIRGALSEGERADLFRLLDKIYAVCLWDD